MLPSTTIIHRFRKENKLSLSEYVLADLIKFSSYNNMRCCIMSRNEIASELDVSKQTVPSLIRKLKAKGFIVNKPGTAFLVVTKKWTV